MPVVALGFSVAPVAGEEYLRIISYNYVASGLIFVSASMFKAMGNTVPSLFASVLRIGLVAIPAVMLARMPGFRLSWICYVSAVAVWIQLAASLWFLRRELIRRLRFEPHVPSVLGAA